MTLPRDAQGRGCGQKLQQEKSRKAIGKNPFHYENGAALGQGPGERRCLQPLRLDGALGNLLEGGRWPGSEQRVGLETSRGLFALK